MRAIPDGDAPGSGDEKPDIDQLARFLSQRASELRASMGDTVDFGEEEQELLVGMSAGTVQAPFGPMVRADPPLLPAEATSGVHGVAAVPVCKSMLSTAHPDAGQGVFATMGASARSVTGCDSGCDTRGVQPPHSAACYPPCPLHRTPGPLTNKATMLSFTWNPAVS